MTEDRFGIVGKVVARTYEVEDVVAEGGFGVVYRAHHKGFRAKVALKCLKIPSDLTEDQRQKFLEQFRSEAEVMFRLSSQIPAIVRPLHVDAFHTADNQLVPFIALEWLEGRTLDAIILRRAEKGRPPLGLDALVRLLTPIAAALEQAHNLQGPLGTLTVIHRDMKPENLFVARLGEGDVAKILDFGISKVKLAAGQLAGRASQTGEAFVAFSPAYAAPEQWAPRRFGQTGRWTDVWGLGITLVEAAKGFEVIGGDHAEMMGTIIDPVRRPTPRTEGVQVSDAVEEVFLKALAVDPRDRYQSIGEFWDGLSLALDLRHEVGTISTRPSAPRPTRAITGSGFDSVMPPAMPPSAAPAAPQVPQVPQVPSLSVGGAATQVAPIARPLPAAAIPPVRAPQGSMSDLKIPLAVDLGARGQLAPSGLGLAPVSLRPRPAPSPLPAYRAPQPPLLKSLGPALSLLALSVALTLLDRAFAGSRGVPLAIGPVRASWIAAGVMVLALFNGFSVIRRSLR